MANAKTNKAFRTFVRGLCTEASPLTYPEDTSYDELNTVPTRRGNRTRRFGMNYSSENLYPFDTPYNPDWAKTSFLWQVAGGDIANTFLVVQAGPVLYFFDRSQPAFAANAKPWRVFLANYQRPGAASVNGVPCSFASGKGFLFVVNKEIEPIIITYDPDADDIDIQQITIQIRDFEGLNDGLANDAEPTTLSTSHYYNLLNQGWIKPGVS